MNASEHITDVVTSWPGVGAGTGSRGEWAFRIGRREVGHLHGDHVAHFFFSKDLWAELHDAGRIEHHPVFPDRIGPAQRRIRTAADEKDVIAILRANYERITAAHPVAGTA